MGAWPAEAKLNKVPETRLEALGGTLLDAELLDPNKRNVSHFDHATGGCVLLDLLSEVV